MDGDGWKRSVFSLFCYPLVHNNVWYAQNKNESKWKELAEKTKEHMCAHCSIQDDCIARVGDMAR